MNLVLTKTISIMVRLRLSNYRNNPQKGVEDFEKSLQHKFPDLTLSAEYTGNRDEEGNHMVVVYWTDYEAATAIYDFSRNW